MMRTVSQIIYDAAGRPGVGAEERRGTCYLCGGWMDFGVPAKFPATFVDYDKAHAQSDYICDACAFCMSERSEVLMHKVGKDKPQCMRNYSHFVLGGEWIPLSKAQKREQYEILTRRPEVAIVAVSGQKHLIFRAQPGFWQVEEQRILPDPLGLAIVMNKVRQLYWSGFSKREILTGDYATNRIIKCGADRWQELESQIKPWRGSVLLELAVFLVQKE